MAMVPCVSGFILPACKTTKSSMSGTQLAHCESNCAERLRLRLAVSHPGCAIGSANEVKDRVTEALDDEVISKSVYHALTNRAIVKRRMLVRLREKVMDREQGVKQEAHEARET